DTVRRRAAVRVFVAVFDCDPARSGSFFFPVSRFHSSKVSFEIFPSTSNCANFRRCAWLLNGMIDPLTAGFACRGPPAAAAAQDNGGGCEGPRDAREQCPSRTLDHASHPPID